MQQMISLFGVFALIGLAWLLSADRRRFPLRICLWGVGLQFIFCVLILGIPSLGFTGPLKGVFAAANSAVMATLDYTLAGSRFMFGDLMNTDKYGFVLALQVLPTIIFISALMAVLYHLGVMQKIILFFALIMQKTMKTSGAETLSAAANIFVGQSEAPLLIKPFVLGMTRSELLCIMVGGMANTAGGVMAAYVGLLRDRQPDIAGHLLTASILSAPASLLFAKILLPESSTPETFGRIPKESTVSPHANVIDAAANGASEGLSLALNVGAMLLAFIALMAMMNALLGGAGHFIGFDSWGQGMIPEALKTPGQSTALSFQLVLGWVFAPIAFLIGIPLNEIYLAGALLGEKTILNEFVAYVHLADLSAAFSDRTFILLSYALSGFANFSSIAIQIGGIGGMAPTRRMDLARLGVKAVIGGTLSTLMTAAVVGVFI